MDLINEKEMKKKFKRVKKIKLNYCGIRNIQCDHVINATIDMIVT